MGKIRIVPQEYEGTSNEKIKIKMKDLSPSSRSNLCSHGVGKVVWSAAASI